MICLFELHFDTTSFWVCNKEQRKLKQLVGIWFLEPGVQVTMFSSMKVATAELVNCFIVFIFHILFYYLK